MANKQNEAVDAVEIAETGWALAAEPLMALAHLPPATDAPTNSRLFAGASAQPWPGDVVVTDEGTGTVAARLSRRANLGELSAPLSAGDRFRWDVRNTIGVILYWTSGLAGR